MLWLRYLTEATQSEAPWPQRSGKTPVSAGRLTRAFSLYPSNQRDAWQAIMSYEYRLNFGIEWAPPIDAGTLGVLDFVEEVTRLVPVLTHLETGQEEGVFSLCQTENGERVREVRVERTGIDCTAVSGLPPREQISFIRQVAMGAQKLQIPKIMLRYVDLRYIFWIAHWGNHHELVASAFWQSGPLGTLRSAIEGPLAIATTNFTLALAGHEDLCLQVEIAPQTGMHEIETGRYDGDSLGILFAIARTGGFGRASTFPEIVGELEAIWESKVEEAARASVLQPILDLARGSESASREP